MTTFDARPLATAWLSVAQASGKDTDAATLDHTIHIEQYPDGIRLVATDRYLLLTAWVPDIEDPLAEAPDLAEAPMATAIARDPDGRGAGLMGYMRKLTNADGYADGPPLEARLRFNDLRPSTDDEPAAFDGMATRYLVIEVPDVERVWLPRVEADFPNWRTLLHGFKAVSTRAVALHPDRLAPIAKVAKINGNAPVLWHFGGADKVARLEIAHSDPHVEGLVMPIRWGFDAETEADDGERVDA